MAAILVRRGAWRMSWLEWLDGAIARLEAIRGRALSPAARSNLESRIERLGMERRLEIARLATPA